MKDNKELPGDIRITGTKQLESCLEWDQTDAGEQRLLLEEDSVYAEDLVQLGLGWQDFGTLVIRTKS